MVIKIVDLPAYPPWEWDSWLMQEFVQQQTCGDSIMCKCNQEVLFLSDVIDASSRAMDRRYLEPRPMEEAWSTLSFLIEQHPAQDFKLWRDGSHPPNHGTWGSTTPRRLHGEDHIIWAW